MSHSSNYVRHMSNALDGNKGRQASITTTHMHMLPIRWHCSECGSRDTSCSAMAKHITTTIFVCTTGQADIVEMLLENMAQLSTQAKDGRTLLCAAAEGGDEEVLDMLLVFKVH